QTARPSRAFFRPSSEPSSQWKCTSKDQPPEKSRAAGSPDEPRHAPQTPWPCLPMKPSPFPFLAYKPTSCTALRSPLDGEIFLVILSPPAIPPSIKSSNRAPPLAHQLSSSSCRADHQENVMMGRTSTQPKRAPGIFAAIAVAAALSAASTR